MKTQPITNKPQLSFGIYKRTKITSYGKCTYGNYKGYNIEIYDDIKDKAKLYYVSDNIRRWIKYKLKCIVNGKEKILKSQRNGV